MKNRKLLIVSFLLAATLIMGVGYANLSGSLSITGDATFIGVEMLEDNVPLALQFVDAGPVAGFEDVCSAEVLEANAEGWKHVASIDVNFYDDGRDEPFKAQAEFVIQYGESTANLPTITLGQLAASIDPTEGTDWTDKGEFDCTIEWKDGGGDAEKEINAGDQVSVIVTVTYDKQGDDVANSEVSGTVNVGIPYSSIQVVEP